jgi:hypothetical protein
MVFSSPWFLLLMAPWLALTLLLLWGRRRRLDIPFLDLWKGPVHSPAPKRSFERPPLWLAAMILAMLLAILAAAGPGLRWGQDAAGPLLTIIVDRGITLSSPTRYQALIEKSAAPILEAFSRGPTDVLAIPGQAQRTDRADWPAVARRAPATATDTREPLRAAVHDRLAATTGPVIVLTDQALAIDHPRLVHIPPGDLPQNIGIERLAVRQSPALQVMLRLRNDSSRTIATVRLSSDQRTAREIRLDLPAPGESRDYFIDLPAIGDTVAARLLEPDDIPADDQHVLLRQRLWPALEPRAALPAEVQRIIASYARLRPPGQSSAHLAIVTGQDALPLNEPAVVPLAVADAGSLVPSSQLTVADHPVTRAVHTWPAASPSGAPAGPGWTAVVEREGQVLVAVREMPARQVWVNLPTAAWATDPSFVVFWTNIFDHLGQGGQAFAARPAGRLDGPWTAIDDAPRPAGATPGLWPGLYRRADGVIAAVNAPVVSPPPPAQHDWRSFLRRIPADAASRRSLTPLTLIACLSLLLVAALTWNPGRRSA